MADRRKAQRPVTHGERRRAPHDYGRIVYSRGPIVRSLVVLTGITGVAACVALALVVGSIGSRVDQQQVAREHAALDTCRLLRLVVNVAGTVPNSPAVVDAHGRVIGHLVVHSAEQRAQTVQFLAAVGLNDCQRYARLVRQGRIVMPLPPPSANLPLYPDTSPGGPPR